MTKQPNDRHSRRLVVPLTPEQDAQARAYARRVRIPLAAIARNALLELVANAVPIERSEQATVGQADA